MRGYKEEGTTTTPFDMCVLNDIDRFHLVGDVIDRVPKPRRARGLRQAGDPRPAHRPSANTSAAYGDDMPEIKDWTWGGQSAARGASSTGGDNV